MIERELRKAAIEILRSGLRAVEPEYLIKRAVKRDESIITFKGRNAEAKIDLGKFNEIYVVALGKAAPYMAAPFLRILKDRLRGGIVLCIPGTPFSWPGIKRLEAPHPLPDRRSVQAAEKIIGLGRRVKSDDLVFFLLSGGASAQIAKPLAPLSLRDKKKIIRDLLKAGADIKELNVVRKHLSAVKGGKLGKFFEPATVVNLIISDVVGDDIETVASAPTMWDSSTFREANDVLKRYGLWDTCAKAIKVLINRGIRGEIEETRKKEEVDKEKVLNFIIGNNHTALEATASTAEKLGFKPLIISSAEQGEARLAARKWAWLVHSINLSPEGLNEPLALISGGELTVTVKGKGKGGRNTEFCLALLAEFLKRPLPADLDWVAASLATDGRDGPTEAAGALISASVLKEALKKHLALDRYLENNDSYTFFQRMHSLITTGVTKTNVMDIRLFLLAKS